MVLCTVLAVAALLSSCHGIYNDLEPCSQGVPFCVFVYDYNMEYANAFHSQVDCLGSVWSMTKQGQLPGLLISVQVTKLKDENLPA